MQVYLDKISWHLVCARRLLRAEHHRELFVFKILSAKTRMAQETQTMAKRKMEEEPPKRTVSLPGWAILGAN